MYNLYIWKAEEINSNSLSPPLLSESPLYKTVNKFSKEYCTKTKTSKNQSRTQSIKKQIINYQ